MKPSLRFSIFKRDQFLCQYCGRTPPAVVLEVDHVHPKSKGGTDEENNLVTSCFECNRGKAGGLLSQSPPTVAQKAALLAEREDQLKAYNRLLASKRRRENAQINAIEEAFQGVFPDKTFTAAFRESIRHNFLYQIPHTDLCSYMTRACGKCRGPEDAIKYFCGICWHVIKGNQPRYGTR